ncbi:MAG: hypothetical protein INR65_10160, partial [Gluconacetobacter diazotrophicus]|nr:hypothetical protein [Gluconacetobacter diazotrophicus]
EMRRGDVAISGTGSAQIAGTPQQSEADGHLVVRGYDQLMQAAGDSGLGKVRAGLFMGKLVAKHEGDGLAWDLRWDEGSFSVNNVPVPIH